MPATWARIFVRAFPFPLSVDFLLVPAARGQLQLWLHCAKVHPKGLVIRC